MVNNNINIDRFRKTESLLALFELLEQSEKVAAKEEALKVLASVCSDAECRNAIRQAGGLNILVKILDQDPIESNIIMIGYATKIIRHLANDNISTRKALREALAVQSLVKLISLGKDNQMTIDAIAALGYLSYKDQYTKDTVREMGALPLLVRALGSGSENPVACYAAAALHNLVESCNKNKMTIRAAGTISRLIQLVEVGPGNPIAEVSVRILNKMCEKCEEIQTEIISGGGVAKLIELQSKTKNKSLINWIEKTLNILKPVGEEQRDDSKILVTLAESIEKEFEKTRNSNQKIYDEISKLVNSVNNIMQEISEQKYNSIDKLNNIKSEALQKDNQIQEMNDILKNKDLLIRELEGTLEEKIQDNRNLETLLREKEIESRRALAKQYDKWQFNQSERDKAFVQLLISFKDIVEPASANEDYADSHRKLQDLAHVIQSLLESGQHKSKTRKHSSRASNRENHNSTPIKMERRVQCSYSCSSRESSPKFTKITTEKSYNKSSTVNGLLSKKTGPSYHYHKASKPPNTDLRYLKYASYRKPYNMTEELDKKI